MFVLLSYHLTWWLTRFHHLGLSASLVRHSFILHLLSCDHFEARYDTIKAFMRRKYEVRDGLPLHVLSSTAAGIIATSQSVIYSDFRSFIHTRLSHTRL